MRADAQTLSVTFNNPEVDSIVVRQFYQTQLTDWSIERITSDKNSWTKKDIEGRANQLAIWAVNRWKI